MLTIHLKAQDEKQWRGENPSSATFPTDDPKNPRYPLYHQWRAYNADAPIIVNTYNTGTGKTKAALLRLLKRAQQVGLEKLRPSQHNALLIAPTNELLAQHKRDAEEFCHENALPYRVVKATREDLDSYRNRPNFSEEQLRRGATLHAILNDASRVTDEQDDGEKRATLYVVNPDIFYYALYFCYGQFDRSALFINFFASFSYLVIDEFHYYDSKQLAAFLFFMKLSQHYGYMDSSGKQRQICILTATPRPQVTTYLQDLGIPIAWIRPGEVLPEDMPHVRPVRALAPVELQVYNTEELQQGDTPGGLLPLVGQQRQQIRAWLDDGQDGAIISSSLGTINRIHHTLRSQVTETEMGRITGAELREGRNEAKKKKLILATPTVDIGYNFDRNKPQRQNIDFLLLDASSGDELVQRIGRAGRVLAKAEKDHPSTVFAVVDPAVYTLLQPYDGQQMERGELAELATYKMPQRNDLYAYLKTGAIVEMLRPIALMSQGTAQEKLPDLEAFLQQMCDLFGVQKKYTLNMARGALRGFDERQKRYGRLKTIPKEAFDALERFLRKRPGNESLSPQVERCTQAFLDRLNDLKRKGEKQMASAREEVERIKKDLISYTIDQARFSFRDSFQPPLALVSDPEHLHSSKKSAVYNVLHVLKCYDARFYASEEEWQQEIGGPLPPNAADALAYCHLRDFREPPLHIELRLNVHDTQDAWEEVYAYRVTALYGLEIVASNDHHGLDARVRSLFQEQFVPALVARSDGSTAGEIRKMQQRARFFPIQLEVTFADRPRCKYLAILGSMAFQVHAELPFRAIAIDRRKIQLEDDNPFIC